jgi:GTPase SAR1 family protein
VKRSNQGEYILLVVGNKIDLLDDEDEENIDDTVKEIVNKYNATHIFTSAKENINISEIFETGITQCLKLGIIERFYQNHIKNKIFRTTNIQTVQKKSGCC